MVTSFSIKDNIRLQTYYQPPFSAGILANDDSINETAQALVDEYDVRTPSIFVNIGSLLAATSRRRSSPASSSRESKLLIAAQPTRGLDVGSIEFYSQANCTDAR